MATADQASRACSRGTLRQWLIAMMLGERCDDALLHTIEHAGCDEHVDDPHRVRTRHQRLNPRIERAGVDGRA